jgi:hypothetical protein
LIPKASDHVVTRVSYIDNVAILHMEETSIARYRSVDRHVSPESNHADVNRRSDRVNNYVCRKRCCEG